MEERKYALNESTGQYMELTDKGTLIPVENEILAYFCRIGDIVMMNRSKESWVSCKVPNGTKGVVVGYPRHERVYAYNDLGLGPRINTGHGMIPGIYSCNSQMVIVCWDHPDTDGFSEKGYTVAVNPSDIHNVTDSSKHGRADSAKFAELFDAHMFLRPLPDLPFWPGDLVQTAGDFPENNFAFVTRIDYHRTTDMCDDGFTPYPIYTIQPTMDMGPSMNVRDHSSAASLLNSGVSESAMTHLQKVAVTRARDDEKRENVFIVGLVKRGNYWAWYNDKSQLAFDSLEEEIRFHISLGHAVEVRNPESGIYNWMAKGAAEAFEKGTIDWFIKRNNAGLNDRVTCYTFPYQEELRAKIRAHRHQLV